MPPAKIAVAHIVSPTPELLAGGLGLALGAGVPVERFGRTWRVELRDTGTETLLALRRGLADDAGSPAEVPPTLSGRLGFDKTTGQAPAWNDRRNQFEVQSQHDGDVVPFVIRLSDLAVSFQRTSKIKRQSFIGAFQKILREVSQDDRWKVEDRLTLISWTQFTEEAERATQITIKVRPTNPGWPGQELLQPYIEETQGEKAKITINGDDLDLDSRPVEQARVHAIDYEYGELEVKGVNEEGIDVTFDSADPVPILDTESERSPDGSVPQRALIDAFAQADAITEEVEGRSRTSLDDDSTTEDQAEAEAEEEGE